MKTFFVVVLVCLALSDGSFARKSSSNRRKQPSCLAKSGLTPEDVKLLKEKTQLTPLAVAEQKYICCMSKPLFYDGKLVSKRLEKIVQQKAKGVPVNMAAITAQCEETGVAADNLQTCPEVATFVQCIFVKVRQILHAVEVNTASNANVEPVYEPGYEPGYEVVPAVPERNIEWIEGTDVYEPPQPVVEEKPTVASVIAEAEALANAQTANDDPYA